jgi:hypothetical protein
MRWDVAEGDALDTPCSGPYPARLLTRRRYESPQQPEGRKGP